MDQCRTCIHTRAASVQLASFLQGKGVSALAYHAGLSATQRQGVSFAVLQQRVKVVVCTMALSSGLDFSSIDAVVHFTLPNSLEEYVLMQPLASTLQRHGVQLV